jgi:hypothetical protein
MPNLPVATVRAAGAALAMIALTALCSAALRGDSEPASPSEAAEVAERGRVAFRVYCSNCHGQAARGDGELARYLRARPADLTRIAERYDGRFPEDWIRKKIDGREAVRGHGMQEMPVWGLNFREPETPGDPEARVTARLDELVAYLRSIQSPKAP